MKKKLLALVLGTLLVLVGCGKKEANAPAENKPTEKEKETITIGVSPVPHEEIINALKDKFEEANLDVKVVVFDDYVQPNIQTNSGDLDANFFQHKPYLDTFNKEQGTDLVSIGAVHLEPLGAYSDKIKELSELKEGGHIIIPNDATNGARALLLLQDQGLIKLKDGVDILATEKDIVENPKNLEIVAMEAANIPNVYKDADLAIINSNYALGAGLDPAKDALVIESAENNPYANIVAVKKEREGEEKFKKLIYKLQTNC